MGLTPLEGLIGGTRCGTIDPTAVFHLLKDPGGEGDAGGIKVSNAELVLNKCVFPFSPGVYGSRAHLRKSGLQALAGTTNFGTITTRIASPVSCTKEEYSSAKLAYEVYLDRLLSYISQYLFKLYSNNDGAQIDGLVFSGGIGEKSVELRKEVLRRLKWLGAEVDDKANEKPEGVVTEITKEGSRLKAFVVETDEEGWCAKLARDQLGF
jgi:acetate kinase